MKSHKGNFKKQKWAKQKMKSREQDCCGMLTVKTAQLLSQPTGTQHAGPEEALAVCVCGGRGVEFLSCCRNPEHLSGS